MTERHPIPQQQWISVAGTFGKAKKMHRDVLTAAEALFLPPGTRLQGRLVGEMGQYLVIDNANIAGEAPLDSAICFFHAAHWIETIPLPLTEADLVDHVWSFGEIGKPACCQSFYFAENGRIGGYKHVNEHFWRLEEGELHVLSAHGRVTWRFGPLLQDNGVVRLIGLYMPQPAMELYFELWRLPGWQEQETETVAVIEENNGDDSVKLVIWDLDDTFWQGTLAEGEITPVPVHIELVKELTARGIVNGICSKNDFSAAEVRLRSLGMWDYFIFPKIAFAPKGAMVAEIIRSAQLRAPSVLFLDDNPMNLEEARHYSPGLQIASPDVISALLEDRRLSGKPDPRHERLARYKVLEQKHLERRESATGNLAFLRQSGVRVSFHHDVMEQFPRIHDLVNRTNQLNFTKRRWPEDEALAREQFSRELEKDFNSHAGYVKVADRYGDYGICGFYFVGENVAQHFLFSCRALNMGIEQFVWHKIGRPFVPVEGEVVSTLGPQPDWMTVVADAIAAPQGRSTTPRLRICVRSACDLAMMTHYLRTQFETIEEFTFPYQGWGIHPAARAVAVAPHLRHGEGAALLARLPCMPPNRFDSAILSGAADIYVLSFVAEIFSSMHRSRSTGLILPFHCLNVENLNFSDLTYEKIMTDDARKEITREQWSFMQEEFERLEPFDKTLLAADVTAIFEMLRGKTVIVLMLNTEIGNDHWLLNRFREINGLVRPIAEAFGGHIVEMNEFVRSESDLAPPPDANGAHYKRNVYMQLAERVAEIATRQVMVSSSYRLSTEPV